ncbi:MAG: nucleotidyltransferase domain-containing protein [Rubrobacter sp.]|jgi:predicted nucleotidyltransferase|nr:nucleotidyltransferase domain-containing protein [Rubrobacter sp.]
MEPARANVVEHLPADLTALLERLSGGLEELYGERYRGLVLYGSYARGEADEGSDVDLLLLLEGEVNPAHEILRSEEVEWPLVMDTDYVVSLFPVSTESYIHSKQPFLLNARKEGIPLF